MFQFFPFRSFLRLSIVEIEPNYNRKVSIIKRIWWLILISPFQGHKNTVSSAKWWHKPLATSARSENKSSSSTTDARPVANYATYIISVGLDGLVYFWLVDGEDANGRRVHRKETPSWSESDVCQLCNAAFFWNIKKMWSDMTVGVRQVSLALLIAMRIVWE